MPGSNNGNSHKNGYHCPRCSTGMLLREWNDVYCLQYGWRLSFVRNGSSVAKAYLTEAIVARLIRGVGERDIHCTVTIATCYIHSGECAHNIDPACKDNGGVGLQLSSQGKQ